MDESKIDMDDSKINMDGGKIDMDDGKIDIDGGSNAMDSLYYNYSEDNNRLVRVDDEVGYGALGTDFDDMSSDYTYDLNGNLTSDPNEGIIYIQWTASGKIWRVIRGSGTTAPIMSFEYDGMGNRVRKVAIPTDGAGGIEAADQHTYTYYIRDAQGNILTTIGRKMTETDEFEATDGLLPPISTIIGS